MKRPKLVEEKCDAPKGGVILLPTNPITLSEDDWGVQSPPKRKVFRFHYHSQKVIGSLGLVNGELVGGFFPSHLKICSSNWIISPGRGENKKYLKPPSERLCVRLFGAYDPVRKD